MSGVGMSGALARLAAPSLNLAVPARTVLSNAMAMLATCIFPVLVGLFGQFAGKALVLGVIDVGHAMLLGIALGFGVALARQVRSAASLAMAACSGAIAGACLVLVADLAQAANLRWMLVSMNPAVLRQIAYRLPEFQGCALLGVAGALAAALGALLVILPSVPSRAVSGALGGVVFAGLLRELLSNMINGLAGTDDWAFNYDGLLPAGRRGGRHSGRHRLRPAGPSLVSAFAGFRPQGGDVCPVAVPAGAACADQ